MYLYKSTKFLSGICIAFMFYSNGTSIFAQELPALQTYSKHLDSANVSHPEFLNAQQPARISNTLSLSPATNLINNLSEVPMDFWKSGARLFSKDNVSQLALVFESTSGFLTFDQKLYLATRKENHLSPGFRKATAYCVNIGDGKWQFAGAALLGLYGYTTGDKRMVKTSFEMVEAVVSTGIAVQLLKHAIGRESPAAFSIARGKVRPFPSIKEYNKNQTKYYSYPSGHTATTVAIFTVLAGNYPEVKWIKPAAYVLTGCLGVSLVSKSMHWYSDLPLAAALGYSFGKTIVTRSGNSGHIAEIKAKPLEISILPAVYNTSKGVSLHVTF